MSILRQILRIRIYKKCPVCGISGLSNRHVSTGSALYKMKKEPKPKIPLELPEEVVNYGMKVVKTTESMAERGFCRPQKSYTPPENVETILEGIAISVMGAKPTGEWKDNALDNSLVKYRLLTGCSKEFQHDVPNSCLHLMKTLYDVLNYYSTPVEGTMSYDQLVHGQEKLPPNLHVIPNALRFHPETDELFQGISAYPKSNTIVSGLHSRKKYRGYEDGFQWPDI